MSNKTKVNWYFLLLGAIALYFSFSRNKSVGELTLKKLTVELKQDVINVKGRKNPVDYKLLVKEHNNDFIILDGSITKGRHNEVKDLKKGTKVDVFISEGDYKSLINENNNIVIRGISVKKQSILTDKEFIINRNKYSKRLFLISLFVGVMLVLNGLLSIPKKINYSLVGAVVGFVIIMKIFEFGVY